MAIDAYIDQILDAAGLNAATSAGSMVTGATGYVLPGMLQYTPEGQSYIDRLYNTYNTNYQNGVAGYGLPGSTEGDPTKLRSSIMNAISDPGANPSLASWIQSQGGAPQVPTLARTQLDMADKLARDTNEANIASQQWLATYNGQLQRDLQAGQISAQQALEASREAHEKAMQATQMAYNYAELAWTKEYGTANLGILRDRLSLDRELGMHQLANDDQRVQIEKDRLGLDRDQFGLEKAIQEAMLRANPMNAVANALYTRGAQVPGGETQYGQPTTTLDNSGTLPFLQQLAQGGIQNQATMMGPMNQQGIGGNAAPQNGGISQRSFGNMSDTERGITSSLAAYNGLNPDDYWRNMQNTWNTAGQGQMAFGGTRMAA